MSLICIAQANEVTTGKMKRITLESGHRVLLVNVNGEFFCIDDTCSHEDASLYLGCLNDDLVKCPMHGSRFNVRTGQPMEEPADEPVATWPITRVGDELCIDT